MKNANNKFQVREEKKFIFSTLNRAKREELRIIVWKIIDNIKHTIDVEIRTIRKFKNYIEIIPDERFKENFLSVYGEANLINFFIPNLAVMFQCEYIETKSNGNVIVYFPNLIAQVERRKALRLLLSEEYGYSAKAVFYKTKHENSGKQQLFEKTCFDISAGGLSFIVTQMESGYFHKGDKIIMLNCIFDNYEILADAKIVNTIRVEPDESNKLNYKGVRVCVKFLNLSNHEKIKLEDFVFRYVDLEENVS